MFFILESDIYTLNTAVATDKLLKYYLSLFMFEDLLLKLLSLCFALVVDLPIAQIDLSHTRYLCALDVKCSYAGCFNIPHVRLTLMIHF